MFSVIPLINSAVIMHNKYINIEQESRDSLHKYAEFVCLGTSIKSILQCNLNEIREQMAIGQCSKYATVVGAHRLFSLQDSIIFQFPMFTAWFIKMEDKNFPTAN